MFILAKLVQTWFAISVAKRSKRNSVTGFPLGSLYCKHAGNVIIGSVSVVCAVLVKLLVPTTGPIPPTVEFSHIWLTIACKTGTNSVGVIPCIFKQLKSKPAKLGLATTPSVIRVQTFVANLNTTSVIVSPLHKSIQAISGPCQITQLDEMLSHPFVELLELVGIIYIFLTIIVRWCYTLYNYNIQNFLKPNKLM